VLPSFAVAALGMPIVVHLPKLYASKDVGLDFVTVGAIFAIMRVLDVVIDPLMGYISDRWRTPIGRRRPVIALGAPLLCLGIWMAFNPHGQVGVGYVCFWLFVMYLGWSAVVVPHLSWGAEISSDYHERSRIYGWYQTLTVMGMMGVLMMPAILEQKGYPLDTQVMAMAIFALATLVPSLILCLIFVPEPTVKLSTQAPLLPTLRFLLRNRAMRRVMAVDFMESLNQGARGSMFLYFASLAIALPKFGGTLLLCYFLSGIVFMPFWIALSKRIGKHRALMVSFAYGIVAGASFFLIPPGNAHVAFVFVPLAGVSYGAPAFLLRAMMADVADADTVETGAERAGIMYSFLSLTSKFGIGCSVALAFGTLAWLGFDPKIHNTAAAIEHLRVFFILLPLVLAAAGLAIMRGYPLDETEQKRLRADIERRRAAVIPATPDDAITGEAIAEGAAE
jgi:Na+/melibiose symporter-like transporter